MSEAPGASAVPADKRPKTTYTPVVMEDGSTVQFAGEQKINTEVNGSAVEFRFRNGKKLKADISLGGLTNEYAIHGITQKLRDEAAGIQDIDDAFEAVNSLYARLGRGEWSVKREGSGFAGQSVLLQAILRAYPGKTIEEARAFLEPLSHKDKITLRQSPKLKPFVDEIEAAKAKAAPGDAEALLSKFGS